MQANQSLGVQVAQNNTKRKKLSHVARALKTIFFCIKPEEAKLFAERERVSTKYKRKKNML
jgi:hypothetical protein